MQWCTFSLCAVGVQSQGHWSHGRNYFCGIPEVGRKLTQGLGFRGLLCPSVFPWVGFECNGLFSTSVCFPLPPPCLGRYPFVVDYQRNRQMADGSKLMRQSAADSDRKFWAGQRPLSVIQWIGVIVLLVGSTVVATSLGFRAFAAVMGGLVAFVLLGRFLAHRRNLPRQ